MIKPESHLIPHIVRYGRDVEVAVRLKLFFKIIFIYNFDCNRMQDSDSDFLLVSRFNYSF